MRRRISQQGKVIKPDVYGLNKRRIKRLVDSLNEEEEEFSTEDFVVDSDSINAAEYLIKQNPKSSIPVCYIHQIYSVLKSYTVVDRELQQAFENGSWRKFHIMGSLEDEFLIMKTNDYLKRIEQMETLDTTLFDKFKRVVLNQKGVSVNKEVLKELTEKELSELVQFGFLLPHRTEINVYWFSINGQGKFISNIISGRMEILRILKKRHTKDILEKLLKQKKLHKTIFNFEFLMHDLIGSGRVEKCSTTMGNLIRLTNKGEKGI